MDDPRDPIVPDDGLDRAESQAERDRARIAARNARMAARDADPVAAAAADARWQAEHAEAIAEWNAWYERNGHPLAALIRNSDHPLAPFFGD